MLITLSRKHSTHPLGQIGEIILPSGLKLFAMERNYAKIVVRNITQVTSVGKFPCIPQGEYEVAKTYSPRFGLNLYLVKDVPGRSGIRFHPANYPNELLGCISLGTTKTVTEKIFMIGNSRLAHRKFDAELQNAAFMLRVVDSGE